MRFFRFVATPWGDYTHMISWGCHRNPIGLSHALLNPMDFRWKHTGFIWDTHIGIYNHLIEKAKDQLGSTGISVRHSVRDTLSTSEVLSPTWRWLIPFRILWN